jgi:hypothetical protein
MKFTKMHLFVANAVTLRVLLGPDGTATVRLIA